MFKVSLKKQFKALEYILIVSVFIFIFIVVDNFNHDSIFIFLIILAAQFLPVLFLHLEYLFTNRESVLRIDYSVNKLEYNSPNKHIRLDFDEIKQIIIYMAPSWHRNSRFRLLPFEVYHYAKIVTVHEQIFYITSLMIEDVKAELIKIKGPELILKQKLIASISFE